MGLFGLAIVLGAILHLFWPEHASRREQGEHAKRWFLWLVVGLFAYTALIEWTCCSIPKLIEAVGRGEVGRFVLGLLLGFAVVRVYVQRRIRALHIVWLGLAAILVALNAPHLDNWLTKLTSLKTPAFEIQLAHTAAANYKVNVAADTEILAFDRIIFSLDGYNDRIKYDMDFVKDIELSELAKEVNPQKHAKAKRELEEFLEKAERLRLFFGELVAPLARCYSKAVEKGGSIERLKEVLRPLALQAYQILANQGSAGFDSEMAHLDFWTGFKEAAKAIDRTRPDWNLACWDEVLRYSPKYYNSYPGLPGYPRIADFRGLPYLYNLAAALLSTVGETDAALKVLENAREDIGLRIDYFYLGLMARLRYAEGHVAGSIAKVDDQMRRLAVAKRKRVQQQCRGYCGREASAGMRDRHRKAELIALNALVYRLSEGLARGDTTAKGWATAMSEHIAELKKSLDSQEVARLLPGSESDFLDTYAYATIAIEAQKRQPDVKIFKEMRDVLHDVVVDFEKKAQDKPGRYARWLLDTARAHYNSARELAGE